MSVSAYYNSTTKNAWVIFDAPTSDGLTNYAVGIDNVSYPGVDIGNSEQLVFIKILGDTAPATATVTYNDASDTPQSYDEVSFTAKTDSNSDITSAAWADGTLTVDTNGGYLTGTYYVFDGNGSYLGSVIGSGSSSSATVSVANPVSSIDYIVDTGSSSGIQDSTSVSVSVSLTAPVLKGLTDKSVISNGSSNLIIALIDKVVGATITSYRLRNEDGSKTLTSTDATPIGDEYVAVRFINLDNGYTAIQNSRISISYTTSDGFSSAESELLNSPSTSLAAPTVTATLNGSSIDLTANSAVSTPMFYVYQLDGQGDMVFLGKDGSPSGTSGSWTFSVTPSGSWVSNGQVQVIVVDKDAFTVSDFSAAVNITNPATPEEPSGPSSSAVLDSITLDADNATVRISNASSYASLKCKITTSLGDEQIGGALTAVAGDTSGSWVAVLPWSSGLELNRNDLFAVVISADDFATSETLTPVAPIYSDAFQSSSITLLNAYFDSQSGLVLTVDFSGSPIRITDGSGAAVDLYYPSTPPLEPLASYPSSPAVVRDVSGEHVCISLPAPTYGWDSHPSISGNVKIASRVWGNYEAHISNQVTTQVVDISGNWDLSCNETSALVTPPYGFAAAKVAIFDASNNLTIADVSGGIVTLDSSYCGNDYFFHAIDAVGNYGPVAGALTIPEFTAPPSTDAPDTPVVQSVTYANNIFEICVIIDTSAATSYTLTGDIDPEQNQELSSYEATITIEDWYDTQSGVFRYLRFPASTAAIAPFTLTASNAAGSSAAASVSEIPEGPELISATPQPSNMFIAGINVAVSSTFLTQYDGVRVYNADGTFVGYDGYSAPKNAAYADVSPNILCWMNAPVYTPLSDGYYVVPYTQSSPTDPIVESNLRSNLFVVSQITDPFMFYPVFDIYSVSNNMKAIVYDSASRYTVKVLRYPDNVVETAESDPEYPVSYITGVYPKITFIVPVDQNGVWGFFNGAGDGPDRLNAPTPFPLPTGLDVSGTVLSWSPTSLGFESGYRVYVSDSNNNTVGPFDVSGTSFDVASSVTADDLYICSVSAVVNGEETQQAKIPYDNLSSSSSATNIPSTTVTNALTSYTTGSELKTFLTSNKTKFAAAVVPYSSSVAAVISKVAVSSAASFAPSTVGTLHVVLNSDTDNNLVPTPNDALWITSNATLKINGSLYTFILGANDQLTVKDENGTDLYSGNTLGSTFRLGSDAWTHVWYGSAGAQYAGPAAALSNNTNVTSIVVGGVTVPGSGLNRSVTIGLFGAAEVQVTTENPNATVVVKSLDGADQSNNSVVDYLTPGRTQTVHIVVTAENGADTADYTVAVTTGDLSSPTIATPTAYSFVNRGVVNGKQEYLIGFMAADIDANLNRIALFDNSMDTLLDSSSLIPISTVNGHVFTVGTFRLASALTTNPNAVAWVQNEASGAITGKTGQRTLAISNFTIPAPNTDVLDLTAETYTLTSNDTYVDVVSVYIVTPAAFEAWGELSNPSETTIVVHKSPGGPTLSSVGSSYFLFAISGNGLIDYLERTVSTVNGGGGGGGGAICFLGSAPVKTPSGYKKIRTLRVGDKVMTPSGEAVAITRAVRTRETAGPAVNPYVIEAGQFGATQRLLISPEHRVATKSGMIEARRLGLRQEAMSSEFDYYNIELEGGANMIVAGVEVESLAPVRRVVMTQAQFLAAIQARYGEVTPAILEKIKRTCVVLPGGHVSCPVLRR